MIALVLASCANSGAGSGGTRLNAWEKMMWSTYPLGSERGVGTGFVVLSGTDQRGAAPVPVVVTSAHLLDAVGRRAFFIGCRRPGESGRDVDVVVIEFKPAAGHQRFFSKIESNDVGAFEMRIPAGLASRIAMPSCLNDRHNHPKPVRPGQQVHFAGYPDVLPETEGAFPIMRTGHVASYPVGLTRAAGLFVIDADVYPGDSGAPVFTVSHSGKPELAGMIVRRVGTTEKSFSHLALAVDAATVYEAVALARRDGTARALSAAASKRQQ